MLYPDFYSILVSVIKSFSVAYKKLNPIGNISDYHSYYLGEDNNTSFLFSKRQMPSIIDVGRTELLFINV